VARRSLYGVSAVVAHRSSRRLCQLVQQPRLSRTAPTPRPESPSVRPGWWSKRHPSPPREPTPAMPPVRSQSAAGSAQLRAFNRLTSGFPARSTHLSGANAQHLVLSEQGRERNGGVGVHHPTGQRSPSRNRFCTIGRKVRSRTRCARPSDWRTVRFSDFTEPPRLTAYRPS
jgi:hypothetical protein